MIGQPGDDFSAHTSDVELAGVDGGFWSSFANWASNVLDGAPMVNVSATTLNDVDQPISDVVDPVVSGVGDFVDHPGSETEDALTDTVGTVIGDTEGVASLTLRAAEHPEETFHDMDESIKYEKSLGNAGTLEDALDSINDNNSEGIAASAAYDILSHPTDYVGDFGGEGFNIKEFLPEMSEQQLDNLQAGLTQQGVVSKISDGQVIHASDLDTFEENLGGESQAAFIASQVGQDDGLTTFDDLVEVGASDPDKMDNEEAIAQVDPALYTKSVANEVIAGLEALPDSDSAQIDQEAKAYADEGAPMELDSAELAVVEAHLSKGAVAELEQTATQQGYAAMFTNKDDVNYNQAAESKNAFIESNVAADDGLVVFANDGGDDLAYAGYDAADFTTSETANFMEGIHQLSASDQNLIEAEMANQGTPVVLTAAELKDAESDLTSSQVTQIEAAAHAQGVNALPDDAYIDLNGESQAAFVNEQVAKDAGFAIFRNDDGREEAYAGLDLTTATSAARMAFMDATSPGLVSDAPSFTASQAQSLRDEIGPNDGIVQLNSAEIETVWGNMTSSAVAAQEAQDTAAGDAVVLSDTVAGVDAAEVEATSTSPDSAGSDTTQNDSTTERSDARDTDSKDSDSATDRSATEDGSQPANQAVATETPRAAREQGQAQSASQPTSGHASEASMGSSDHSESRPERAPAPASAPAEHQSAPAPQQQQSSAPVEHESAPEQSESSPAQRQAAAPAPASDHGSRS